MKNELERHRVRLFRLAYSWCHQHSLAEDLTQETMAQALKSLQRGHQPQRPKAWLSGILYHCWQDFLRRKREHVNIDDCDLAHEFTPEREYEQGHLTHTVRGAITHLPMDQRQTLTLIDLGGVSYAEAAEILQVPIGTIMSRLCRARKSLANMLLGSNNKEQGAPQTRTVLRSIK